MTPKVQRLKNGLTLVTVNLPHLDSVTTLVAVGAGTRYEAQKVNGISHFLEHMFFKGSKKFPSAELIAELVDGMGAVNNAWTSHEVTSYWIKSATAKLEMSLDILSSMLKEPLLKPEEVERERGVIIEEIKMINDDPARLVFDLYQNLQFGDQPLGWHVIGTESIINSLTKAQFKEYMQSLYLTSNMALVLVGNLPKGFEDLAQKYFGALKDKSFQKSQAYQKGYQDKPRVAIHHKKTDQASIVLGVEGFDRSDSRRYPTRVLSAILGEGMSSRLFIQVRERRGLAYYVRSNHEPFLDTGMFWANAGLKLSKLEEGIKVIKEEMQKMALKKISAAELKKGKDMIRGRLALRSESTNFLAEVYGVDFVLDRQIETFEEYLAKIESVTAEDIQAVAKELFKPERYNLQMVAPLKNPEKFKAILKS